MNDLVTKKKKKKQFTSDFLKNHFTKKKNQISQY